MTFTILPIGKFLEAKRHISRVGELLTPLYATAKPEDPEDTLKEAQSEWEKFLALAASDVPASEAQVVSMTFIQTQELAQSFFSLQVGSARK